MKTVTLWTETVRLPDNADNCVYDLCFSPDGTQLIVALGMRILICDADKGTTIKSIKDGHKGLVFALSYSAEGKVFASGGQDKTVIVWSKEGTGVVKYTHNDAIQCIAFSPSRELLVSCSINDFGLWTQEKKNVNKIKVSAKINVCAWGREGEILALGLANGVVSLRNQLGEEHGRVERQGGTSAAIWGLAFATTKDEGDEKELLCVADWGQTLSFYNIAGKQLIKERPLNFDPMRMIYVNSHRDSKYLVVVGSNRALAIFTLDGIRVASLAEQQSWIWTVAVRPEAPGNACHMAVGTGGGVMSLYDVQILIVHALFKSLYAFRVNMTDVKVQNLDGNVQVVMKCRDLIKKVAISKYALAVQLPEKVLIYQREERTDEFKFRLAELMNQKLDCSLLVMCSEHLVVCQDKKLLCFTFNGTRVREWNLGSNIRYIRCCGGTDGMEVLLAGLKDGEVVKIFLDNLFPVHLVRVPQSVRCLDLNHSHTKIAVIDDSYTLYVYALGHDKANPNQELLFQEPNAVTVFWNTLFDDLLSFSSMGQLSIKANGFKTYHQKMPGFVVGFSGTRVFSMSNSSVQTIEVSLSTPLKQYADAGKFTEAYKVACLGVNERDWVYLGNAALRTLNFEIAKKAFAKMNRIEIVRLIKQNEKKVKANTMKPGILMGEVLAYQGSYAEAAKLFKENKEEHRAVSMYADLRMFDLAQEFLSSADSKEKTELMKKKADWAVKLNEFRVAAEMYLAAGEKIKAIELMEANGWTDMLLDLGPKLNPAEGDELSACAEALVKLGQVSAAAELFRRFGAMDKVLKMYVTSREWDEVFLMAKKYPEYKEIAYLPYAQWLAEQDRFAEAQKAFHEAGRPEEAFKVLFTLRDNAVTEMRYNDVSYYHWILSSQYLDIAGIYTNESDRQHALNEYEMHFVKAVMYYCYHTIHTYIEQPFTPFMPEALFNISRFLMLELITEYDLPVPKFHLLYTLAKQARFMQAFKLSRYTIDRIRAVRVPESLEGSLDNLISQSKGDPIHDSAELLPLCYRCSTSNPLLNPRGNRCLNCFHPFVYSFPTFEVLPLIQFVLEDGISDEEAMSLIGSRLPATILPPRTPSATSLPPRIRSRTRTLNTGGEGDNRQQPPVDILQLDGDDEASEDDDDEIDRELERMNRRNNDEGEADPFTVKSTEVYDEVQGFVPVKIGREILRSLEPREVVVCKLKKPLRYKFYRNCIPDTAIAACNVCWMLFHADDLMVQMLTKGCCPFCRSGGDNDKMKSNESF